MHLGVSAKKYIILIGDALHWTYITYEKKQCQTMFTPHFCFNFVFQSVLNAGDAFTVILSMKKIISFCCSCNAQFAVHATFRSYTWLIIRFSYKKC
jgi:hypothetical protein